MMNNFIHDEKENISFFVNPLNKQPLLKFPSIQTLNANAQKKAAKPKAKPQKNAATNVRAGDWVCLMCNNLNFSFRNECNRCQVQTKKQNYVQSLLLLTDNSKVESSPSKRAPLKDVTNHVLVPNSMRPKEPLTKNPSAPPQIEQKSKELLKEKELKSRQCEPKISEPEFPLNRGFENMLLVTPPRNSRNQEAKNSLIFKEYVDSNQKVFPPYKSPQQLPSISPILRKLIREDVELRNGHDSYSLESSTFADEPSQNMFPCTRLFENDQDAENFEPDTNFLNQKIGVNSISHETGPFYSTDTSPEIRKNNNFQIQTHESPQLKNIENISYASNLEDHHQNLCKEKNFHWLCQKCGNVNYSFRKSCNRCQLFR